MRLTDNQVGFFISKISKFKKNFFYNHLFNRLVTIADYLSHAKTDWFMLF